jgi:hypothetical protein
MTPERAWRLLEVQAGSGRFYNAIPSKRILSEVTRRHGRQADDQLIVEPGLDRVFGSRPCTRFEGGLALDPKKN